MAKYMWYCEKCVAPLSLYEVVRLHQAKGHTVTDFKWPDCVEEANRKAEVPSHDEAGIQRNTEGSDVSSPVVDNQTTGPQV